MYNLTQEQINAEIEFGKKVRRIAELKQKLAETDYKTLKFAEGAITAEDYAGIKAQRQKWRDEINSLENE